MEFTIEQFKKQNLYWKDKFYHYAIHITDGGAIYLYQVDGRLTKENIKNATILRIDGCDVEKLCSAIKMAKGGLLWN